MPDLPPVNEDFTADNSDFIAKVQEMIDKIQQLSDTINELTGDVETLHGAIDDLPDQKTIRIEIESIAKEYVEELHLALDDLPRDKEVTVMIVGEALAQIEALEFALDELPKDKIIQVTVVYDEVGKPSGLELPESGVTREIDQGVTQAITEGTQAIEQAGEGTAYSAEVISAEQLADAMGEIAETAPLAAEGAERLAIGAGDIGDAAEDAGQALRGMGDDMDDLTSAERIAALQHARDYLDEMAQAERAQEGIPAEGTKIIQGITVEDFFDTGDVEGEGERAGDEFAQAAARSAETEAAAAGTSDLAKQMFGGPIEDDMMHQGEQDAEGWFKGLVGRLRTQAINPDDLPHLPGVSDGKGSGPPGEGGGGGGGGGGSAYEGMFEGVLVAAGAAAPFIAQALSGAITAGLGFALAGVGIYAAMQLKPVKAAFKDFEDSAKTDLMSIGKVFEPVMLSIFHVATDVFGALTPVFKDAEETIAGPFKVWADTFIKTFENPEVKASIEAVAKAFASILKVVTPELAGMAEKFAGALIALVNNIGSHPEATADFLNFLATIPVAILNVLNALTDIAEYMETHPLFGNLLDISAFEHMFNALEDLFHGDFLSALKNLGDVFTSTFQSMWHIVNDLWDTLPPGFRKGVDQIIDDIRTAFEKVPGLIKGYWDDAVRAVSGGWDDIINALFGGAGGGGVASKASGILGTLESVWGQIENATKVAWNDVKNAIMVPWNAAVGFVENLGASFSSWWATHGSALATIWTTVWDTIKAVTETAFNIVVGIVRIGIGVISQAWSIFWTSLVATAKEAWAIIGPVVTAGWGIVKAMFSLGASAITLVWNNLWSVLGALARTAWDAVVTLMKVGWDLIVGAFNIGMAAVKAVWSVMWSVVETVAKTTWDLIIALLKAGWDLLVGIFSVFIDVLTGHWSQAWNDIKSTAEQIWNAISGFFTQAFGNFEGMFDTIWNSIKNFWSSWWGDVKTIGEQVWNSISSFFDQAFNNFSSMFDEIWNNVKNFFHSVWEDIDNDIHSVWSGIMGFFDGIWSDIRSGFNNAVNAIQTAWGRLQGIFDGPVHFLVHTVYDDGIANLWNHVASVIPGLPHLPTLAQGGKLPGYGGGDILPALLEPGETVVSKEHSQTLASAFRAVGVPGYADGGSTVPVHHRPGKPGINPVDVPGGDPLSPLLGFLKDAASIGAAVITGNTTALLNDLSKFIGTGGATGDLANMIVGIPKEMIKALIKEATGIGQQDLAKEGSGPAGGATGSEMANGAELYQYLLTNVFQGHKIAAAGAIASIWGESSWNPFSVNCVPLTYKVVTQRGILHHWEVKPGDLTPVLDPETGRVGWSLIHRVPYHFDAQICRMGNKNWSVVCTWNHKWITKKGLVQTYDMEPGTQILIGPNRWETVDFAWDMGIEDTFCLTTSTGTWTAYRDEDVAEDEGCEVGPFWTGNTDGRGLIGWTPAGTISNAAFEGGMRTQEPAIVQFINSSGDWGVIRQMMGATSVFQAANEWGVGVERYGIDDVHSEGVALATSIMNSGGSGAPAQKEADVLAKAARGTQDAGGWIYPGMNVIENKTGQLERTYPPGQGPDGGMIHNVLNVDGKTIFEAVKPYVYQYNSRNSGNGKVNGTWRPN